MGTAVTDSVAPGQQIFELTSDFKVNSAIHQKKPRFIVRPLRFFVRGCAGAEALANCFGTYLCDCWELSVQIYARVVLIHHNIHLSNVLGASCRFQGPSEKTWSFF